MVHNRPRPLREFDQIYMKTGDLVIQSDVVAGWAPASASPSSATATSSAFASPICATPSPSHIPAPLRSHRLQAALGHQRLLRQAQTMATHRHPLRQTRRKLSRLRQTREHHAMAQIINSSPHPRAGRARSAPWVQAALFPGTTRRNRLHERISTRDDSDDAWAEAARRESRVRRHSVGRWLEPAAPMASHHHLR